jgi:hypothetical protein
VEGVNGERDVFVRPDMYIYAYNRFICSHSDGAFVASKYVSSLVELCADNSTEAVSAMKNC